ncbi:MULTISPECIES: dihydrofolate reductase family protein [unclassified Ekhidna]|jgi:dihydrofolate reductase|uniref:dihydrofolate reductase family protein n=1 Tax=unclassified Ekhidna TaxID=2632188 RepID=UPI0032DE8675
MHSKNSIYLGVSLDGYIADKDGGLDWLDMVPNPEGDSMGYYDFMDRIDALVMGRNTFETVDGFDVEWPYQKPVFVLSNSLTELPGKYEGKAFLIGGELPKVLDAIHQKGYHRLYIDGGITVQQFLKEDLIDEMILTQIPILLGGGIPLFDELPEQLKFKLVDSKVLLNQLVQNHYVRDRN